MEWCDQLKEKAETSLDLQDFFGTITHSPISCWTLDGIMWSMKKDDEILQLGDRNSLTYIMQNAWWDNVIN